MLKSRMADGTHRNPTIREVAKLAHVGLMTVSRVINNHPSVRPGTRKKVQAAILQLDYKQNEAARLLKGQRAMTVGLIVPDLSDSFFSSCAHTVQHIARAHGYMTLVAASERDPELEIREAELMASRKVSGLLVVTSTYAGDDRLRQLQHTGLAIVAFDRPLDGMDTDCVLIENRVGAEDAVSHLLGHGYRRIACLGYDEEVYTIKERIAGYTNCMLAAGLPPEIAMGLPTLDHVRRWLADASRQGSLPEAIFSLNHRMSVFLLHAFHEKKIAVPRQVALVGFDDFDLSAVVSPPLTTVSQSPVELATRSMTLLLERIQGLHDGISSFSPAKVLLPTRLLVRSSCGAHHRPAGPRPPSEVPWS